MKFKTLLVALLVSSVAWADDLPDLGDSSQSALSPAQERKLGEGIMAQIRSNPAYLDDPEVADYLNTIGYRLVANSPDPAGPFEFFAIADNSINAFALPGGFVGVHAGLLLAAQSESELASVLSHEIAHVTQRHIARLIAAQQRAGLASMAALAVAILAARSNSQVSAAAIAAMRRVRRRRRDMGSLVSDGERRRVLPAAAAKPLPGIRRGPIPAEWPEDQGAHPRA